MKRIIVCCDGTWNDLDMRYITNVGRLVQCLGKTGKSKSTSVKQSVYYDDGVGAAASGVRRALEGVTGIGIDEQIYSAYRHICINYEPGDEICLFGFSRGAFAVRSIAGMIGRLGLVAPTNLKHLSQAMDVYRNKNTKQQNTFKKQQASFSNVKVTLLGCWDTVGALGIPDKIPFFPLDNIFRKRYEFHDTELGNHIERALHAVAIDERRKEFGVTMMNKPKGAPASQKLIQTWFPGDHGCVGGGSWEKRAFSNHCLKWMIDQAQSLGIDLGANVDLLHDAAITDPGVFFSQQINIIYGRKDRPMPDKLVQWKDIDATAKYRWQELPDYRPSVLKRRFKKQLDAWQASEVRVPAQEVTSLATDQSLPVRVFSKDLVNRSYVQVSQGERLIIMVNRVQVWKDGGLDPCDIQGWNTITGSDAKPAYKDGEQVDSGALKKRFIRSANSKRVVKTADWFELIISCGEDNYERLAIKQPKLEAEPYAIEYQAKRDGELLFTANDLSHTINAIDKYDNNTGWVWLTVTKR
ncbi:DUF2235 domain-containing protein [Halioxenophilus aromaticivorans]|uniref:T6SS Phospholipase effector Tle1-like catalytic domain-containing protein n=1 Tax=Halioxenophilus aromaticivorans TaxID=1306992 RepID=A0AAV3U8A9_9ALTE